MTEIIVVPHTDWDREWHEPFQRFRCAWSRYWTRCFGAVA